MLNLLGLIIVYTRLLEYYIQLWIVWNIWKPKNKLTGVLCMDSECHSQDLCLHFLLQGVISAFCFCRTARVHLKKHIKHIPTVPVGKNTHNFYSNFGRISCHPSANIWFISQRPLARSAPQSTTTQSTRGLWIKIHSHGRKWGAPWIGNPQNGWFINGKSSRNMDDLVVPPFEETPNWSPIFPNKIWDLPTKIVRHTNKTLPLWEFINIIPSSRADLESRRHHVSTVEDPSQALNFKLDVPRGILNQALNQIQLYVYNWW